VTLTAARRVADAVLYEGYLLYPYRASSAKNQVRWQFGVLGPAGAVEAGVGEPSTMSCDLLLDAGTGATVDVLLRFLQVLSRDVEVPDGEGWRSVDELVVGGTRWVPFSEALPRELSLPGLPLDAALELAVEVPAGRDVELLREGGRVVGRLVRTRDTVRGVLVSTPRAAQADGVHLLRLAVENTGTWDGTGRDDAARSSFVGTHLLVTVDGGAPLSVVDPPERAVPDARACRQERCWPVVVADDEGGDAVLVAPIVLGDHPTIAPESAGDLFDATEIDEILTLRVLTMTDLEKAEARGTDPRAAAILDRCEAMSAADLERLHGARRDVSPETDEVLVAGTPVAKGSRVLLRPTRRADAQDMFLAGLTAVVARVYVDLDGATHVAVALEDDPGADLYEATGRFYYFAPDELEPLPAAADVP
jgi:hypothetical protein